MQKSLDVLYLTRKLLSFNTINPPGQEHECAKYIGRLLEDGGFNTSYYEFAKGRTSLIARIENNGNKAPICFTGHIDTVPLVLLTGRKIPLVVDLMEIRFMEEVLPI